MNIERFNVVRKELCRLYTVITEQTFLVVIPLSSFMTLKQLDHLKDNPPLTGFETVELPVERPFTIRRLLQAVDIMGDELQIGFRYPRQDTPFIYESIQEWIRLWIEIKTDLPYFQTPSVEELELIEKLAKHIFGFQLHYHHEKVNKALGIQSKAEMTLVDVLRGKMMFGDGADNDISYISYLDQYKDAIGYRSSAIGGYSTAANFLGSFGGH